MNITKSDLRDNNQWAKELIDKLSIPGYYGKLSLSFENGKVTLARKEETLKPKGAT